MTDSGLPALFAPIRAERYRARATLSDLVAPPYDVLSAEARAAYAAKSEHNIVRVTSPEASASGYAAAARVLELWRAAGVLERDGDPSVYVVQQEFLTPDGRNHVRTGVIGGLAAEGYGPGRVRPHERTHEGPKEDRLALGRATRTAVEPIFVLARDARDHLRRRLDGVTRHEPSAVASLEGVAIGLWRVAGVQAREIAKAAASGPLYIADGHHRYETATALREAFPQASRIPALVVPVRDPGLVVLATHRLIQGRRLDPDAVIARLSERLQAQEREAELDPQGVLEGLAERPAAIVLFPGGRVWTVAARDAQGDVLEIAFVEREIVQVIAEAVGNATVTYTANPGEVIDWVAKGGCAGVFVRPTAAERVLAVADAGDVMPPKSTYFAPKVPGGLLLLPFDDGVEGT